MRIDFSRTLTIGLCFVLSACQLGSGLSGLSGLSGRGKAAVLNGAVRIAAPQGYCIKPPKADDLASPTVVFLGRCSSQSKKAAALVTLTIGAEASGGVMSAGGAAMAAFFRSDEGRATLSRTAQAQDVTVLSASGTDAVLWLYLKDAAVGDYWRAITAISGRLVTLSATGTPDHPLLPEEGRALLEATYAAMQKANR